jgi:pyrimidine deaminase RibD-like protein
MSSFTDSTSRRETDLEYMKPFWKEEKAQGKTVNQPTGGNPIIVKDGEIVGRGHTSHLGGPHAEVNALRMAGEKAKGATVYVRWNLALITAAPLLAPKP